jgi:hypothetical protein
MRAMPLADLLPGRIGLAGRLPGRLDDLRGPDRGMVRLPRGLAWPGLRECDVSEGRSRRTMYGMLLAKGRRNDIARLVNPGLLSQDWALISPALDARLCRSCERRLGLRRTAGTSTAGAAEIA